MQFRVITFLTFAVSALSVAGADRPDFFLISSTCKVTFSSLTDFTAPVATESGDLTNMSCSRNGSEILCKLSWGATAVPTRRVSYHISVDAPPILSFTDRDGGDYVIINTVEHTGIVISRFLSTSGAGAKVCVGMFTTAMEAEAFRKEK